jgi:hypothetical protein
MKITKKQLKQLIKEELQHMREDDYDDAVDRAKGRRQGDVDRRFDQTGREKVERDAIAWQAFNNVAEAAEDAVNVIEAAEQGRRALQPGDIRKLAAQVQRQVDEMMQHLSQYAS